MRIIEGKLTKAERLKLRAGEEVLYSGTFYTARDQAHKRLAEAIKKRKKLPVDLKDAIIYYCGPTPSKFQNRVGSAGPHKIARRLKIAMQFYGTSPVENLSYKNALHFYRTNPLKLPSNFEGRFSAGPTTSSRMDKFTPVLLAAGVGAMIGKGNRSKEVVDSIKRHKAVYFLTIGGAGAYLSERIKRARIIAYPELGTEAIYEFKVEKFPLIVGIDARGRNIYKGK